MEPNSPLSPHYQINLGIEPFDVMCKEGQKLILKTNNGNAACVEQDTLIILIQRGWGVNPNN